MGDEMTTFAGVVSEIRGAIKAVAKNTLSLKEHSLARPDDDGENKGEVIANLMLCYRHLEDASMRLGKVLQAYDGGVSVYDKATTVGVELK